MGWESIETNRDIFCDLQCRVGEGQREREEDRDEGGGESESLNISLLIVQYIYHRPTRQSPEYLCTQRNLEELCDG